MNYLTLCTAAIALAGSATLAGAQSQTAHHGPAAAAPRDAAGYVAKAGASDQYEIQSSQLAQQKASSSAVRRFGQMMIEHHTMTTQQVTDAARRAGMTPPPPMLEPHQQAMLDELRGVSGAAFDTAYVRQQRLAHDEALALHSGYAKNGDTPALRTVARTAVPIVRRHIAQLRSLPRR
jgi:putative membrane protein